MNGNLCDAIGFPKRGSRKWLVFEGGGGTCIRPGSGPECNYLQQVPCDSDTCRDSRNAGRHLELRLRFARMGQGFCRLEF